MTKRILFVDDDPTLLESLRRNLRATFDVETAPGPQEALDALKSRGPFAVVVADYKMPGMDGVHLLAKVAEHHPDTVRIMLTGFADLDASIAAVNEGRVFRFLTKPCPMPVMARALEAGLHQHRLVTAEKELLRGTLRGCITVLTDLLSLVNPVAFGRSDRIRRLAVDVAKVMGLREVWKLELAARLSQIGCISIPEETLSKKYAGMRMSQEEEQIYSMHASVAAGLLSNIPRMEEVVEAISRMDESFLDAGPSLPMASRILRAASDFDMLAGAGMSKESALEHIRGLPAYDPEVVAALERAAFEAEGGVRRSLAFRDLKSGMILAEDLLGAKGLVLLAKDQEINEVNLVSLKRAARLQGVREPVGVRIPLSLMDA